MRQFQCQINLHQTRIIAYVIFLPVATIGQIFPLFGKTVDYLNLNI